MERADRVSVFAKANAFVFINGSLMEGEFIRKDFEYDHEEDGFQVFKTENVFLTHDGEKHIITDESKVFESVEDYEANRPAKTCKINISDRDFLDAETNRELTPNCDYWTFDENAQEPIKHTFTPSEFTYIYNNYRFYADVLPDEEIYDTREEALTFNTYKVTDKNGKVTERVGTGKLLMLDKEQEELVMQLERTMQDLQKAGVMLIIDNQEFVRAFNIKNVDYEFDENEDKPFNPGKGESEEYEKFDRFNGRFAIKSTIEQWSDYFNLFIKRENNK